MGTRVHIGCPPGLSIIFDAATTSSHFNQYCTPTANISCFYSGNSETICTQIHVLAVELVVECMTTHAEGPMYIIMYLYDIVQCMWAE